MEDLNQDLAPATEWDTLLEDTYEDDRAFRQNFILSREMLDAKLSTLPEKKQQDAKTAENMAFATAFEASGLPAAADLLARLDPDFVDGHYDYVARLTAKDSAGNYVLDENLSREIFSFYGKAARKLQEDFRADVQADLKSGRYARAVDDLIERDIFPKIFRENAAVLDPDSPSFKPPKYYLYDIAHGVTAGGHAPSTGDVKFNLGFYRKGFTDPAMYHVLDHEQTHHIAGERIYHGDEKSSRGFNEALTESIAYLITVASGKAYDGKTLSEVEFGDGISYLEEREAMKPLVDTPGGRDFYLTAYALKTGEA